MVVQTAATVSIKPTHLFVNLYPLDNEDPVISDIPGTVTVDATSNEAQVTWTEPSAFDNSGIYTLTSDYAPGSFFQLGVTEVTYTATDPSSNTATAAFNIIVQGTVIQCNFIAIITDK